MKTDSILKNRQINVRNTTINRMIFRNRAVLRNDSKIVLAEKNRVNLNAWITNTSTHNNIGDYLSLLIISNLCKKHGVELATPVKRTRHLYAIGSILPCYKDATVWGSGFGYDKPAKWYSPIYSWFHRTMHTLDIRAVRGPETRRILTEMGIDCPEVYGDPAVLMPLFYPNNGIQRSRDYVLIPHYSKLEKYKGDPHLLGTFTADYRQFIDKILEAKLVISSSLYGIILAEAYGIPAVMLHDTPSLDITKYTDWYASTGRHPFAVAKSVEHALELGGTPLDYQVIEQMQSNLLDSFPVDLWNE